MYLSLSSSSSFDQVDLISHALLIASKINDEGPKCFTDDIYSPYSSKWIDAMHDDSWKN